MKICFQYSRDQQMKNLHKNLIKTSPWSGYLFKQQPVQKILAKRSDSRDIAKLARRFSIRDLRFIWINFLLPPKKKKKSVEYCVCIFYTVFWTINRHTRSITVEIIHWLIVCDEQVAFALSVNSLHPNFCPHEMRWVALLFSSHRKQLSFYLSYLQDKVSCHSMALPMLGRCLKVSLSSQKIF